MSESAATSPTAADISGRGAGNGWPSRVSRIAGALFALLMVTLALTALHHLLREHHLRDILASGRAIPARHLGLAALATVSAYIALTGYDTLAFLYIRRPLAYPRIALTSFVSYAFSMNLGFGPITGTAVRYRLYSGWGLGAVDVAKVVAFCGLTIFAVVDALTRIAGKLKNGGDRTEADARASALLALAATA